MNARPAGRQFELEAILAADPSGWTHREPTDADYATFRAWAITGYGITTYTRYLIGGWADYDRPV